MKCPLLTPEECDAILVNGDLNSDISRIIRGCDFFMTRAMPKESAHARYTLLKKGDESGNLFKNQPIPAYYDDVRTDLAVTVFLSDPNTYEGGELVLDYPSGALISLKEPQGTMVYYPAGIMHRIMPVTSGERYTYDVFFESHVQDPQQRDILAEMESACAETEPFSDLNLRMANIKHNLYRLWMTT